MMAACPCQGANNFNLKFTLATCLSILADNLVLFENLVSRYIITFPSCLPTRAMMAINIGEELIQSRDRRRTAVQHPFPSGTFRYKCLLPCPLQTLSPSTILNILPTLSLTSSIHLCHQSNDQSSLTSWPTWHINLTAHPQEATGSIYLRLHDEPPRICRRERP